jgi:predicted alpha/beta hydrolase family esterase
VGREERKGLQQQVSRLWEIHSPLSHRCRLPPDRCLIIASQGDRLCPFEDVKRLHAHWGRPEHVFLRGGHALFFPRDARGEAWYGFLRKNGFI